MTSGPDSAEGPVPSGYGQPWPAPPAPDMPASDTPASEMPGYTTPPGYTPPPGYTAPGYTTPPGYTMPGSALPPFGQPPPTYRVWAWIAAVGGVLFNLILGLPSALAAIRYGRQVREHWEAGDQAAAVRASHRARTWSIVSTVLDALGVILVVVVIAGSAGSASNFSNPSVVAASIKTQLQKRISDPSSQYYVAGLKVTRVVCTSTGTNTDHCVDYFSNGQTASETAVIAANGQSYETR